jgi:inorganic pyrophosphatase
LKSYTELPEITLKQIEHFFAHYKDLEPNKWVKIGGWADVDEARKEIMAGVENYKNAKIKPEF